MARTTSEILTLALSVTVLFSIMSGHEVDHRPPAGTRTAFDLISGKARRHLLGNAVDPTTTFNMPDPRDLKLDRS
jgi:hypothetical protein